MKVAIDTAGRLVVPKAIREQARLRPGMPLEIVYRDGRIEIQPTPIAVCIETRGSLKVAVPLQQPGQPLNEGDVHRTLEEVREAAHHSES